VPASRVSPLLRSGQAGHAPRSVRASGISRDISLPSALGEHRMRERLPACALGGCHSREMPCPGDLGTRGPGTGAFSARWDPVLLWYGSVPAGGWVHHSGFVPNGRDCSCLSRDRCHGDSFRAMPRWQSGLDEQNGSLLSRSSARPPSRPPPSRSQSSRGPRSALCRNRPCATSQPTASHRRSRRAGPARHRC